MFQISIKRETPIFVYLDELKEVLLGAKFLEKAAKICATEALPSSIKEKARKVYEEKDLPKIKEKMKKLVGEMEIRDLDSLLLDLNLLLKLRIRLEESFVEHATAFWERSLQNRECTYFRRAKSLFFSRDYSDIKNLLISSSDISSNKSSSLSSS